MQMIIAIALAIATASWMAWDYRKKGHKAVDVAGMWLALFVGGLVFFGGIVFAGTLPQLPWKLGDIQSAIYGLLALAVAAPIALACHYIFYWITKRLGLEPSHPAPKGK